MKPTLIAAALFAFALGVAALWQAAQSRGRTEGYEHGYADGREAASCPQHGPLIIALHEALDSAAIHAEAWRRYATAQDTILRRLAAGRYPAAQQAIVRLALYDTTITHAPPCPALP